VFDCVLSHIAESKKKDRAALVLLTKVVHSFGQRLLDEQLLGRALECAVAGKRRDASVNAFMLSTVQ
jgi:hypothetical protein